MASNRVGSTGDYSTLSAWETARQGSSDATETAQLLDEDHADDAGADISGWTNAPDIVIEGEVAQDGQFGSGPRFERSSNGSVITYSETDIDITVRDLTFASEGGFNIRLFNTADAHTTDDGVTFTFERILGRTDGGAGNHIIIFQAVRGTSTGSAGRLPVNVDNCVFVDAGTRKAMLLGYASAGAVRLAVTLRGCTFYESGIQIGSNNASTDVTITARGCLWKTPSASDALNDVTTGSGTYAFTSEYCQLDESSATHTADWDTSTGNAYDVTFNDSGAPDDGEVSFFDAANDDYRLYYSDWCAARDFVDDDAAMPSTDIEGNTRATFPRTGAFESPPNESSIGSTAADYATTGVWLAAIDTESVYVAEQANFQDEVHTGSTSVGVHAAEALILKGDTALSDRAWNGARLTLTLNGDNYNGSIHFVDLSVDASGWSAYTSFWRNQPTSVGNTELVVRRCKLRGFTVTTGVSTGWNYFGNLAGYRRRYLLESSAFYGNGEEVRALRTRAVTTDSTEIVDILGCTFHDTHFVQDGYGTGMTSAHSYTVNIEGTLYTGTSGHSTGGAMTPTETTTNVIQSGSDWNGTETNVTDSATFHLTARPSSGEVAFVDIANDDIRINYHPDDLARTYLTDTGHMPTTDITGATRSVTGTCGAAASLADFSTYDSAGGADYSSMSTWETAKQSATDPAVVLTIEDGDHGSDTLTLSGWVNDPVVIVQGRSIASADTWGGARFSPTGFSVFTQTGLGLTEVIYRDLSVDAVGGTSNWNSSFWIMGAGSTPDAGVSTTFSRCKLKQLYGPASAGRYGWRVQSTDFSTYTLTLLFENCAAYNPAGTVGNTSLFALQPYGDMDLTFRGCTFEGSSGSIESYGYPGTDTYTVSVEGTVWDSSSPLATGGAYTYNVTLVDVIQSGTGLSSQGTGSETNVTDSATINHDSAPASGEVSFVDLDGDDLRLWDDANNAATDYVTTADLDIDIEGTTRPATWSAGVTESVGTGTGGGSITGTSAWTLPLLTQSATGTVPSSITGTSAFALVAFTHTTAIGTVETTGTAASSLPVLTMSATGVIGDTITGTGAWTLPSPLTMISEGTLRPGITGSSSFSLPPFTSAGTGTAYTVATGTIAFGLPVLTMQATGVVNTGITGTSAWTLPGLESRAASPRDGVRHWMDSMGIMDGLNL